MDTTVADTTSDPSDPFSRVLLGIDAMDRSRRRLSEGITSAQSVIDRMGREIERIDAVLASHRRQMQ